MPDVVAPVDPLVPELLVVEEDDGPVVALPGPPMLVEPLTEPLVEPMPDAVPDAVPVELQAESAAAQSAAVNAIFNISTLL